MSTALSELRHALRGLSKRPVFSLVVVVTLSLGIGANTVIFDLLNLTLWQRPPVDRPEELVRLHTRSAAEWLGVYGATSYADYADYRERARSYTGLATFFLYNLVLDTGEITENVTAGIVTPNYFEVLGVGAALGRTFTAADGEPGSGEAVVVSHRLWHRLFHADPGVVGRTVRLDGRPFTVIGVAAEGFDGTLVGNRRALWTIFEHHRQALDVRDDRSWAWTWMIGRLRPGVTRGQAEEELRLLAAGLDREHPLPAGAREMTVVEARFLHPIDRRILKPIVRILLLAVALLLLITCANIANLLLVRATSRRREMAVRTALGASRGRLVRPLVLESLVLAAAGGLLGIVLAAWGRRLVATSFEFQSVNVFEQGLQLDARLIAQVALICGVCAVLSAIVPARSAARVDLAAAVRNEAGPGAPGRRLAAGELLVVVQVALSMVLLASTGLLARSMWNLWSADAGFETGNLLSTQPTIARAGYPVEKDRELYRRLIERAEALPGVRSVGRALVVPPTPFDFNVEFRLPEDPDETRSARVNLVDAGFFTTLGIPLVEGRLFDERDRDSEQGVVVVNATLAERLWPGQGSLGREILVEPEQPDDPGGRHRVIGVVGASVQDSFAEAQPILYFSADQRFRSYLALVMRTEGDPRAVVPALRRELRRLDPALALDYVRTQDEARWNFLVGERVRTLILGSFALLGLVLAVVGVASVLSYAVSRRIREVGIRMALGARAADVRRAVMRRGLGLTAVGVVLGAVAAVWSSQLLRSFLFGVDAVDPWVLTGVALILLTAAAAAAWWPARRAAAVDPLVALRHE